MPTYRDLTCSDEERRVALRAHGALNGIDYVEVVTEPDADNQRVLDVYFIPKTTPDGAASLSSLVEDLAASPEQVTVEGGERVRDIEVVSVSWVGDHLEIRVSHPGDFSDYTLVLTHPNLDPVYAQVAFNFKAGCPSRFDCKPRHVCPPEPRPEPLIDYMAKDYASFRQALLDLIPTLAPDWTGRHAADLGIALVELMAYTGDQLSYYQDAVANEAYLKTARQRISVRRHARLIDYRMHDGASARAFVHLRLDDGTSGTLPKQAQILTRISIPLPSQQPPHGPVLAPEQAGAALAAAGAIFETFDATPLHGDLNEIPIHDWGNRECCLPRGATTVDLLGDLAAAPDDVPDTWRLKPGDFLLFEEVIGPKTGLEADADPTHRQIVRLTSVERTRDPVEDLELTRVMWSRADALIFPLCISTRLADGTFIPDVSVARGNLVLADHGRTVTEWHPGNPAEDPDVRGIEVAKRAYRFHLREGPLSVRLPVPEHSAPARALMDVDRVREARPQVWLNVHTPTEALRGWEAVPDLLNSDRFDAHFVAETDNDGRAIIRLGHDGFGMAPPDGAHIEVTYRVGIGSSGSVGAESLVHVIRDETPDWPDIAAVRNPLAAWGGLGPESTEHVKQLAPAAFHAEQFRAVTEEDYARASEKHPEVSNAVATFRWTGSWHTVFVTVDPVGRTGLPRELKERVHAWVTRFALAGYDLAITPPRYVSLDVEIEVCVEPTNFRAHVEEELLEALSTRTLPDGRRGFFHPDRLTFRQPLYLSQLYAAIARVEGVESAVVTRFQRFARMPNNELEQGYIPAGRIEILRLDNDPNFPENGVLRLILRGGK